MENAHTYTATVHAQITIYQEVKVCLIADNKDDLIEKAKEAFNDAVEGAYGWVDYDDCTVEDIEDLGELPF